MFKNLSMVLVTALILVGCSRTEPLTVDELSLGMDENEALSLLGKPARQFQDNGQDIYLFNLNPEAFELKAPMENMRLAFENRTLTQINYSVLTRTTMPDWNYLLPIEKEDILSMLGEPKARNTVQIYYDGSEGSHEEWFYPKHELVITLDDGQVNYRIKTDIKSDHRIIDLRSAGSDG